jgi:hypothetical protein
MPTNDPVTRELIRGDRLLQLELQIARRADELARQKKSTRDVDLWLEAEREILPLPLGPNDVYRPC